MIETLRQHERMLLDILFEDIKITKVNKYNYYFENKKKNVFISFYVNSKNRAYNIILLYKNKNIIDNDIKNRYIKSNFFKNLIKTKIRII